MVQTPPDCEAFRDPADAFLTLRCQGVAAAEAGYTAKTVVRSHSVSEAAFRQSSHR